MTRDATGSRPDRGRRLARILLATLLLLAVAIGLWNAHSNADRSLAARLDSVTSGLRCPTCSGQSVADSESDLARRMRAVAAEQLAAGRTPDQVKTYFVQRYGRQVLLDPPLSGLGLVARLVPFVLLVAGGVIIARRLGRRRGILTGAVFTLGLSAVLVGTGVLGPVIRQSAYPPPTLPAGAAASPTASAQRTTGTHAALEALQSGDARTAEREARGELSSARHGSRRWQDALLVLGLAQHQLGDKQAEGTLQRFLNAAPKHPAAPMVRKLLAGG